VTVVNNFLISFVFVLLSIVWLLIFFSVLNCVYRFFYLPYCDLLCSTVVYNFLFSFFFFLLCGCCFSFVSFNVYIDFLIFSIVTYCVLVWFEIFLCLLVCTTVVTDYLLSFVFALLSSLCNPGSTVRLL